MSIRRAPQFVIEIERKDGTTLVEHTSMSDEQLHSFVHTQRRYDDVVKLRVYELKKQLVGVTLMEHDDDEVIW